MAFSWVSDVSVLFIETANSLLSYTFSTQLQRVSIRLNAKRMDIGVSRHWSIPDWQFVCKIYLTRKRKKQKEEGIKIKAWSKDQCILTDFLF